jgi:DNA-binding CsgD family transcriptional regulator
MDATEPFVVLLDRSGRASWASRGESGVQRDELLGTTIWDWTIPEDCDLSRRCFADCLFSGRRQDFLVRVNAKGNIVRQHVWLDRTVAPVLPVVVKSAAIHPGLELLTPRQTEILRLIGRGQNRKQIARQLGLCVVTVDAHCANISERLSICSAAELAVFATLHGCHI